MIGQPNRVALPFRLFGELFAGLVSLADMEVDASAGREGYRYGARDAIEACSAHMLPRHKHLVNEWLRSLEKWHGGPPPACPSAWRFLNDELVGESAPTA